MILNIAIYTVIGIIAGIYFDKRHLGKLRKGLPTMWREYEGYKKHRNKMISFLVICWPIFVAIRMFCFTMGFIAGFVKGVNK